MNEDLEQSNLPVHIYTHRRLLDMINRNKRRLGESSNYIVQNYNRFFHTELTPNQFLDSISQETVNELAEMQIDPSMEGERRRLLIEIDRYRKIRATQRELRAVLMIMSYNRLSRERRRRLNIQHLAETGMTYVEEIDRVMPVYPYYFRGLRTIIPSDTTSEIGFDAVGYNRYRMVGGNRITLGGVLPETLVNPVFVGTARRTVRMEVEQTMGTYHGHTRDYADDYYDLDDKRPTGKERENSLREAEERNRQLAGNNGGAPSNGSGNPSSNPSSTSGSSSKETDGEKEQVPTVSAPDKEENTDAEIHRIRNLVASFRKYENYQELNYYDAVEVRQLLQTYDIKNPSLVHDALGDEYDGFMELVDRLRTMLSQYDEREMGVTNPINGNGTLEPLTQEDETKAPAPTVSELQAVERDADLEQIQRAVDLGNRILNLRFSNNANRVGEVRGLIDEYDELRLNPETAELARSMERIYPRIATRVNRLRERLNDQKRPSVVEVTPTSDFENLRTMINNMPDPNLVLFNRDIEAFHQMARIMELYHAIRTERRFNESPVMRLTEEGKLTRKELEKLKAILRTYREIYANQTLRDAFLRPPMQNSSLRTL